LNYQCRERFSSAGRRRADERATPAQ